MFLDLFESEKIFGDLDKLTKSLKVSKVVMEPLENAIHMPRLLLIRQCLGYAAIMKGVK